MKKIVTCRGRLLEDQNKIINWFDGIQKILKTNDDFVFMLVADESFPEQFKYIQDNNNLEFLKIQEIK